MQEAKGYEGLGVYQRTRSLLKPMHELALRFPDYEKFDLASQIRRANKSIPANIAEGYAKRRSGKEFAFYLTNAMGSANEMEVHLQIAHELGYISPEEQARSGQEYAIIGKQLNRLIAYWRSQTPTRAN
ncbi:MAG: four helix bundle protein [Dehalococcoidia bacterium]